MAHKRKRASVGGSDPLLETRIDFGVPAQGDEDDVSASKGGLGSQVLPVLEEPPEDWDGLPGDGTQYLYLVRQEAANQPKIVRTNNPYPTPPPSASASPLVSESRQAGSSQRPSDEWRDAFIAQLHSIRSAYENAGAPPLLADVYYPLPPSHDEAAWRSYIHGRKPRTTGSAQNTGDDEMDSTPFRNLPKQPTALLLKNIPVTMRIPMLMEFEELLSTRLHAPPSIFLVPRRTKGAAASVAAPKAQILMPDFDAQWILALLGVIDTLLTSEDVSNLRALAKTCILAIKELRRTHATSTEGALTQRAGCWMVIAAVSHVWMQKDLWEVVA